MLITSCVPWPLGPPTWQTIPLPMVYSFLLQDIESIIYLDLKIKNVEIIGTNDKNDTSLFLRFVNALYYLGLIYVCHFVDIFGVHYYDPV